MSRYFVTGASGFIGAALTRRLVKDGHEVYALVRSEVKKGLFPDGVVVVTGDLLAVDSWVFGLPPFDAVFHLGNTARYPEDNHSFEAQLRNSLACCQLFDCLKFSAEGKFVLVGTSYCAQVGRGVDGEFRGCSIYGVARVSAENILRVMAHRSGVGYNGVYLTNCFGVGDTSWRSTNFILKKFLEGVAPPLVSGEFPHDWIYIDDLVEGLVLVAAKGTSHNSYYLGNRNLRSFREIIEGVRDIIAPGLVLDFGSLEDSSRIDYSQFDLDLASEELGFECSAPFDKSVALTAEWVKSL
jgi:UDP-glucose 4-epimerase